MKKIIIFLGIVIIGLGIFGVSTKNNQLTSNSDLAKVLNEKEAYIEELTSTPGAKIYTTIVIPGGPYERYIHTFVDSKELVDFSETNTAINTYLACRLRFEFSTTDKLTVNTPPLDWPEFNKQGYGYVFKYPNSWKIEYTGKSSEESIRIVANDGSYISINKIEVTDENYHQGTIVCDKRDFYEMNSTYKIVYRPKNELFDDFGERRYMPICIMGTHAEGNCIDSVPIGMKFYKIYYANEEKTIGSTTISIMDSIIHSLTASKENGY